MNDHQILDLSTDFENWAGDLAGPVPAALSEAKTCGLPPALAQLKVRVGVRRWPEGEEKHFHAALSESLLHILRRGGEILGEAILPPLAEPPLDSLRYLEHGHHWSDPVQDLSQPLWLALVQGVTRHFGIEYKLIVQINTRWGISPSPTPTPRELLSGFGFDPAEFSLYYANSAQPLPPDTPIHVHRGEHFEAQKDGRYGAPAADNLTTADRIDAAIAELTATGYATRSFSDGGQRYVEVSQIDIPSPPWSLPTARILIAVPSTYPIGGLDAFYLEKTLNHGGNGIPYEQSQATIGGRQWALISWHYPVSRPWNANRDDLATHVYHCRGYFLRRGVTQ